MKIGRRSFLSFLVGGAAGTTLSPLPWKLTDDLSIWSQNWPWTPVPEDGEVSHVDSTCSLCPGGCGISVRKVEDRAVKIEGIEGHPANNGGACVLGLAGLQLLYGPTRVKTPLKRTGERGEGKWVKISWDEAISEIGQKLGEIRSAGQSHSLACISGSDRGTIPHLFSRFLTVFGSPNFIRTPSIQDSYELTLYLMHGVQGSAGFDFENADFILSFGSGIIDGWGSPVRMFKANSSWKEKNAKVIQIEPRLSNTAAKSDKWIPINPGTEAALALGIAHVMIKENLYSGFVENHAFGFEDWYDDQGNPHKGFKRFVLEEYGPDAVSKITGIDIKTIWELARNFAKADKPLAICGRGQGTTPGSIHEFMAVHALNAMAGNINKNGGFWAMPEPGYIFWPEVSMDQTASKGMQKDRLDGAGSEKYPYARYRINQFIENIDSGKGYPVKALLVSGANPLYSLPDSSTVKNALDKIPFVVSFSSYMDETAENADLILPNHNYLERYEDVPSPVGFQKPFIGLSKPVIAPRFNTKHTGDVIIEIAKAMGGNIADAFAWESYEACLEETLGNKWEALNESGYWMDESFTPASLNKAFETDSRKFEFSPKAMAAGAGEDMDALPHFKPVAVEGDEASYPLILVPYDSLRLSNGYIGNPPFMVKTVENTVLKDKDVFVEMNPKTAQAQGLSEGKYAILSTPKGKAKVRVHLFEGIMPGLVAMPRGLGHTAYDDYLAGKGINFNKLVGPVIDPVSGLDAAYGIRAKLSKA
jgi:menaquinone reductase, molybdopterin-binding-like subunit